jgi:hypothetical protein
MMHTRHRFRSLTGTERRVVLEAAAALPATWLALRLAGFNACRAALAPTDVAAAADAHPEDTTEMAKRIARLQTATARNLFFRATCLEQSLALCWMLRRRGMNPELRIGARKEANRLEAHAWVELNGAALDGVSGEHKHFVPFETSRTSMETQTH